MVTLRGQLIGATGLEPAEPLWKRVPQRDENGRHYSDFMMVIPGLRAKPPRVIETIVNHIQHVLSRYPEVVVFADLNLKLNVLWVSVKPVPGICLDLAAAIHMLVPEAKLIAPQLRGR